MKNTTRRLFTWCPVLFLAAAVAHAVAGPDALAQSSTDPAFEAASIKRNISGDPGARFGAQPGGRLTVTNNTLYNIIRNVYQSEGIRQIVGGEDWINSDRWDITAKAEGDPQPQQMLAMMKTLLADRFKLVTHKETREVPIYALVLARPDGRLGPQLQPSTVDCAAMMAAMKAAASGRGTAPPQPAAGDRPLCGNRVTMGMISAGSQTMQNLANGLSRQVGRLVVDRTGLKGSFDFDLKWTPDRPAGAPADQPIRVNGVDLDPNGPSVFTALQEQLGLKLDSTKGPVDVLVIDRAAKPDEQ
jgi:uncharacterized protein (TIGR03435 family)